MSYKQMREPLKTSVTIMRTKYEILISRKQFVQQQIKYITESIHSNSLQNKYFCKQIHLEVNFLQHFLLIDRSLST